MRNGVGGAASLRTLKHNYGGLYESTDPFDAPSSWRGLWVQREHFRNKHH